MDSYFNAQYDVNVLASAFNMDKATFQGSLFLIDNWTTFDNERFDVIRANSDMLEEVTSDELAILNNVKAVIVDEEWFQVYDNQTKFTEVYVSSGVLELQPQYLEDSFIFTVQQRCCILHNQCNSDST